MLIVLIGLGTLQTSQAPWFKCVHPCKPDVLQNGKHYLLGHLQNTYACAKLKLLITTIYACII